MNSLMHANIKLHELDYKEENEEECKAKQNKN